MRVLHHACHSSKTRFFKEARNMPGTTFQLYYYNYEALELHCNCFTDFIKYKMKSNKAILPSNPAVVSPSPFPFLILQHQ